MLLVSGLVLGLLASRLTGGDWRRLQSISFRWLPVIVLGLALRFIGAAIALPPWFYLIALGLVAIGALRNVDLPGVWLIAAGTLANFVVIALNGGMPLIDMSVETDALHVPITDATRLPFLGDVIPVFGVAYYSAGDAVIALGGFVFALLGTRR